MRKGTQYVYQWSSLLRAKCCSRQAAAEKKAVVEQIGINKSLLIVTPKIKSI